MVDHGQKLWRNGALVDWVDGGSTSVLTHTLHYGVGAFEGIRAYRRAGGETAIFRLDDHLKRLMASCHLVQLKPPFDVNSFHQGCIDLLRANALPAGYLRPFVMYGSEAMGIHPGANPVECFIAAWAWGAYLGDEALESGIRCKISPYARHHIGSAFAKGKLSGQYINSVVAKQDAKSSGFDEALLCDVNGHVCEGTGENLFIVSRGTLMTPPLSGSILEGITRATVIELAKEEGIPVAETAIPRDVLYLADEAFLTGTAAELTPVREVDFRSIGNGKRGEITELLQRRYFDVVRGTDDSHPEWLTLV